MTMAQMPPQLVKSGVYWWLQCDAREKQQVLEELGHEMSDLFQELLETLLESLNGANMPPAERMLKYKNRTEIGWELLRQYFPKEYDRQRRDWHKLLMERGG